MEFLNKIKTFLMSHRRNLLITTGIVLVLLLFLISIFYSPSKNNPAQITPVPTIVSEPPKENKDKGYNPLISNEEVERVENATREKLEKLGKKVPARVEYKFNYQLSSRSKLKSMINFPQAQAASCNINTAPTVLPVYILKQHLHENEAKEIAKEFDLDVAPASFPTEDSTFQYAFVDTVGLRILKLTESSGIYDYHKVINPGSEPDSMPNINVNDAKTKALLELGKHNLSAEVSSPVVSEDERYHIKYTKNYSDLIITDKTMITVLDTAGSPCNVKLSNDMGHMEVQLTKKGNLFKFINNTRKIDKTFMFSKQNFTDSFNEYKDNPGLIKVVIGTPPPDTNNVIIDDQNIQLIWYDYGDKFAQVSYVPMYLTKGTVSGSDSVVYTLFPAIAKKDLDKTIIDELVGAQKSLQLKTFKPKPPKPAVTVPPYAGGCPGNLIDFTVSCTGPQGDTVCSQMVSVQPDQAPDGYKDVCDNGCKSDVSAFDVRQNQDPCGKYLEQLNIPGYNNPEYQGPAGTMSCSLQSCPC